MPFDVHGAPTGEMKNAPFNLSWAVDFGTADGHLAFYFLNGGVTTPDIWWNSNALLMNRFAWKESL